MTSKIEWNLLGAMDYDQALEIQMQRAAALLANEDDRQCVYIVEHPRTITIGRNGSFDNILLSPDELQRESYTVREVDRGGDVTYHGPGQLVVYPVLHLAPWNNDVSAYVRHLEEVVIRSLSSVGITSERADDFPGVWVGDGKICAVGARVKRRPDGEFVTYHGFALNVNTLLSDFDAIIPCGIRDKGVTSVAKELGEIQDFDEWVNRIRSEFDRVFTQASSSNSTLVQD